jgi:hypothetical protein
VGEVDVREGCHLELERVADCELEEKEEVFSFEKLGLYSLYNKDGQEDHKHHNCYLQRDILEDLNHTDYNADRKYI